MVTRFPASTNFRAYPSPSSLSRSHSAVAINASQSPLKSGALNGEIHHSGTSLSTCPSSPTRNTVLEKYAILSQLSIGVWLIWENEGHGES